MQSFARKQMQNQGVDPKSPESYNGIMEKQIPWPTNDDEARRFIHGLLRKNCPNGFLKREANEKLRKISGRMQALILKAARDFPGSLSLPDIDGRAALHWLARYDAPELMRSLISLGADPLCKTERAPYLPVSEAAQISWGKGLEILALASGVDTPATDPPIERWGDYVMPGSTALMEAAMCCNDKGIETLLSIGAHPAVRCKNGQTALHALCHYEKKWEYAWPCAKMLLDADPSILLIKDDAGRRPDQLAREQNNPLADALLALAEQRQLDDRVGQGKSLVKTPRI